VDAAESFGGLVEDHLTAQAALSRAAMEVFDALPLPLRRFVAEYPHGLPMGGPRGVAQAWSASEGDVALTIDAMRMRYPVRSP
jgi:hypothetical protein